MAPLDTGRFIITHSEFKNVVYLADANSCSDLHGDWQQNRPGEMWNIVRLSNGNYTISNYGYSSYASCEYGIAKPDVGNNIVGGDHQQQWKIVKDGNSYVICSTKNGHVYWHLADGESGTPVTLQSYSQTNKIQWEFIKVKNAEGSEGSGAVGGGEAGRVFGNDVDNAPSTPVVQVPTPGLPTLASASSLVMRSIRSIFINISFQTASGDNWQNQLRCSRQYLSILKYSEGRVSDDPTELSLTPVGGPNEFRITEVDSGRSWNGLVFEWYK